MTRPRSILNGFQIGFKLCKGLYCIDLGESVQVRIYLKKSASIQPRTSPAKFARSPRTDPRGRTEAGGDAARARGGRRRRRASRDEGELEDLA